MDKQDPGHVQLNKRTASSDPTSQAFGHGTQDSTTGVDPEHRTFGYGTLAMELILSTTDLDIGFRTLSII